MAEIVKKKIEKDEWLAGLDLDKTPEDLDSEKRICPVCEQGELEYDPLLNLVCNHCGYTEARSFS
jgi:hypothetical protein